MLSHSDNDQTKVAASQQLENVTTSGPDFEPQEEEVKGGVIEQILGHQDKFCNKIKELSKTMPTDFVTGA